MVCFLTFVYDCCRNHHVVLNPYCGVEILQTDGFFQANNIFDRVPTANGFGRRFLRFILVVSGVVVVNANIHWTMK